MKYLNHLWQLTKEAAKAKDNKAFWERTGKNARSQNSNTKAKIGNMIFAIHIAYVVGALEAFLCPNCNELIPNTELISNKGIDFFCPLCNANIDGDSADDTEVIETPRYRLATEAEKFEGLSFKLLNGDDVPL